MSLVYIIKSLVCEKKKNRERERRKRMWNEYGMWRVTTNSAPSRSLSLLRYILDYNNNM